VIVPATIPVAFDADLKNLVDLAPSTEQIALAVQTLRNTQALISTLSTLSNLEKTMDELAQRVAANTTVIESAITLIGGFKAKLDAAGTDPAKLAAFSAELAAEDAKLAAAVAANTDATTTTPAANTGTPAA
jgi:translation initiation factor 1 (eIF-1/SUI1)